MMCKPMVAALAALGAFIMAANCANAAEKPSDRERARMQKAAPEGPSVPPKASRKLLVFSLVPTGYVHSAIPYGKAALKVMAEKTGAFEVTLTDDIGVFEPERLSEFDAVFFNNANNELFLPPNLAELGEEEKQKSLNRDAHLKESLVKFVRGGKGLVVLHAGLAIFREWDEWGDIMGGRFDNHPWNQEVTLRVEEPDHPLSRAFGGPEFVVKDEIYQVKGPYSRETHRVLLSLDLEKSGEPNVAEVHRKDGDLALAWIKPYGEGRVFYCGLGHYHELFWNPIVLQFLLDGTQFALGDLEADMTPSAKVK